MLLTISKATRTDVVPKGASYVTLRIGEHAKQGLSYFLDKKSSKKSY